MIRPQFFNVNRDACATNAFIHASTPPPSEIQERAMQEHNFLIEALQKHSIPVHVFDNTQPDAIDALFCNNWVSVHHPPETEDHRLVLYPMMLENRRIEVRHDICDYITQMYARSGADMRTIDLRTPLYYNFLEGTGSLVIDRERRVFYAALSERTHLMMLRKLAEHFNHRIVFFHSEHARKPVYHTNVLMAIGHSWIVICKDAVAPGNQPNLMKDLESSGKTIVEISVDQMRAYCANIIELTSASGQRYTVMSENARKHFTEAQQQVLGNILSVPFDTIEKYGGGGVRCCIAEI